MLLESLGDMIGGGSVPAVFVVSADGFTELFEGRSATATAVMVELGGRLSRFVRSNDVLAVLGPGRFALGGSGVEEMDAAKVLERVRGIFAVPIEVDGEFVSLPITVGVAHGRGGTSAARLLATAESDLEAKLDD